VLKQLKAEPLLVVAGEETSHTRTLKQVAIELGVANRVDFTGFIDDQELFSTYARAKAYVQTSIREPFGLGPLEAQSYGTPAVVWGDAGVRETVLDGETGFHATPYDLEDFASKLDLILSNEQRRSEMSRTAQIWASTFSWEGHVDTLEGVLDEEKR
jgi:1,4-alpha-glucan branching enzyme